MKNKYKFGIILCSALLVSGVVVLGNMDHESPDRSKKMVPITTQTIPETTAKEEFEPMQQYVTLTNYGDLLPVYRDTSEQTDIIAELPHGTPLIIEDIENGYGKIVVETPPPSGQRNVESDYGKSPSLWSAEYGFVQMIHLSETPPARLLLPIEDPSIPAAAADQVSIHVFKGRRELELRNRDDVIGKYSIGLGFSPEGHKEREGDGKTPESTYYVCVKNGSSKFYLSLGLSYPNSDDAQRGLENNLITPEQKGQIDQAIQNGAQPNWNTPLGGAIMIHGYGAQSDWTAGCVAVENRVMDILWAYCIKGTPVTIYP